MMMSLIPYRKLEAGGGRLRRTRECSKQLEAMETSSKYRVSAPIDESGTEVRF